MASATAVTDVSNNKNARQFDVALAIGETTITIPAASIAVWKTEFVTMTPSNANAAAEPAYIVLGGSGDVALTRALSTTAGAWRVVCHRSA